MYIITKWVEHQFLMKWKYLLGEKIIVSLIESKYDSICDGSEEGEDQFENYMVNWIWDRDRVKEDLIEHIKSFPS